MGKVLRVLVIVIFVLGVGALVLAGLNFSKREVLIGRTHAWEDMFVKIAKTIEAQDPADVPQPSYPQRDVSPVTSRELDNPEVSAFWDSYNGKYEPSAQPIPTLDYTSELMRKQLRQYYRLDAMGKPELDSLTGKPATTGKGTMDELLQAAFERAKAQNALLNKVRAELPKVREELVSTIEDLNQVKRAARTDKKKIEELEARIAQLEQEKRDLERKIERLEEEKRELNAELQEARKEIEKEKENYATLEDQYKRALKEIERLKGRGPTPPPVAAGELKAAPGVKGKVVSANEKWKFVVIECTDEFMVELLGPDRSQPMPAADLMVRRPGLEGAAGDFVTRIHLRQVIRDQNLIIADTLMEWQQVPVQNGDVVYF